MTCSTSLFASDDSPAIYCFRPRWRCVWLCSFDRIASIATRICLQMRRRPVSVLTNAHSARIALRKNCRMSARTVVAALRRDRSAQRQNGAQGCHSRSGRPQQSESTCPTAPMISQLTRHGLSTYRRKTADLRCWHIADLGISHRTCLLGTQSGHEQHALWGRGPHASLSATPKKSSAREATK